MTDIKYIKSKDEYVIRVSPQASYVLLRGLEAYEPKIAANNPNSALLVAIREDLIKSLMTARNEAFYTPVQH